MVKRKSKPALIPEDYEIKRKKRFLKLTFPLIVTVPLLSYLFVSAAAFMKLFTSNDIILKDDFTKLMGSSFAIFAALASICFSWRRSVSATDSKESLAVSQAAYHFFGTFIFFLFQLDQMSKMIVLRVMVNGPINQNCFFFYYLH